MKFEAFPLPVFCQKPGAGDGTAAIWSSNGMRLCTLDWGRTGMENLGAKR